MIQAPRRPRPLREGDLVALCAPSSGVEAELFPRLERAIARLQQRGLRVLEGQTLRREHKQCSAPAAERAAELQSFLLDPEIGAVLPPWGGERAIELLPPCWTSGAWPQPSRNGSAVFPTSAPCSCRWPCGRAG